MNQIKSLLILLTLMLPSLLYAADIHVRVDRTQIELNETFTLIFEASESPDDDPDFSPLEKDFQVLAKSTSSNMSIINGEYKRSKKWSVSLIALHEGSLSIPAISFGSDSSPAYQINIMQPQKSTGKAGEDFISELEIDTTSVYTQAQIIVTQRLLSSKNITAYEFSALKTRGIEVVQEKLGELKQYQSKRGNKPYLILEQSYALYPQSAGNLIIEPSIASARIALQNQRSNRSGFDPFRSNTKTVRRSSDKKTIEVKAIPAAFKGKHWLTAKEVQLVEEFPESQNFKAGEPITRTLVLLVDGQIASQLPEFFTPDIKGLKQYPDKPLLKNNISETGITGMQQIKIAIIPAATGSYTLPEISIPWWNTQSNTFEIAKIKERTFTVAENGTNSNSAPQITPIPRLEESNIVLDNQKIPATAADPAGSSDNSLPWKITSLFLGIGLLFALWLLWRKNKTQTTSTIEKNAYETRSIKQALKHLKQASTNNDTVALKAALLEWAQALFTEQQIHSLGELAKHVDATLMDKINSLNESLYRNNSTPWQCPELYDLCLDFTDKFKKQSSTNTEKGQLESLYK